MTEIDNTSLFTIIISSTVSVLGAVGGLEFIKFTVRIIQSKTKRKLKEKSDTTDFYKKELDELQDRYRKQEDRLNNLLKQIIDLNEQITKQAATIAELSSQLQIYKCTTLECPYRNKNFPPAHAVMANYGVELKQNKPKQTKKDKKEDVHN